MVRRMPYLKIENNKVSFVCPVCNQVIPIDLYKLNDYCPHCYSALNRTSKTLMKKYYELDKDLYNYFIVIYRRSL